MASGRKRKGQVEAKPAKPAPEEVEEEEAEEEAEAEAEEEGEQEDDAPEVEEEDALEEKPRQRRTAKTRAPNRSATAPAPRRKAARKEPSRRRDPRQPSLFSRGGEEKGSRTATRAISILLSLLAIVGLFILFQLFAGSRFFALKGVDVVWPDAKPGVDPILSAGEVEEIVRGMTYVKSGVLKADLDLIRDELKKNPLMREVEVGRLLPDRLRVSVVERQPVALARRNDSSIVCVDDEGVMFGSASNWRGGATPPPINGLAEGVEDVEDVNRHWLMMYKRLKAELEADPPLWSNVDEIFFDKGDVVRLMLTEKRGWVLVGSEDFRTRLNVALDILAAVGRKDLDTLNVLRIGDAERLLNGKINYVNVNDPKRPVIGLDE
jgi:POTRA domain-containing FtsQ-type protein/merozoite surface protein (SPAM)